MKLIIVLFLLAVSILIGLLSTYIIVDIVELFDLPFLKSLTYLQVYGYLTVVAVIKYKYETNEEVNVI
jgi:hypothetical protein